MLIVSVYDVLHVEDLMINIRKDEYVKFTNILFNTIINNFHDK